MINKFKLNGLELARAKEFEASHEMLHGRIRDPSGGRYTISFTVTSIGCVTKIYCGACKKEEDISDYESW